MLPGESPSSRNNLMFSSPAKTTRVYTFHNKDQMLKINTENIENLLCQKHPSYSLKYIESKPTFEDKLLLCEMCKDSLNDAEKELLEPLDQFLDRFLSNYEKRKKEEEVKKNKFRNSMVEFMKTCSQDVFKFIEDLKEQQRQLTEDFKDLSKRIEEIRKILQENYELMAQSIKSEMIEAKKILSTIYNIKNQKEEMKMVYNNSDSWSQLERLNKILKENSMSFEETKLFFEEIRSKLIYTSMRDLEETENIEQEKMANCSSLTQELRKIQLKIKYPLKYKHFQNSEGVYESIVSDLENSKRRMENLDKKLLMSEMLSALALKASSVNITSDNHLSILCTLPSNIKLNNKLELVSNIKTNHSKGINCMTFYGRDAVITGSRDLTIQMYNLKTFKKKNLTFLCEKIPYSLLTVLLADGKKMIVIGLAEGYVMVIDDKFKPKNIFRHHESVVSSLIALEDGRFVASASYDSTICIFDVVEGKDLKRLKDHSDSINCLDWISRKKLLVSGSDDSSINFFQFKFSENQNRQDNSYEKSQKVKTLDNKNMVKCLKTCKDDERLMISGSYKFINVWNIDNPEKGELLSSHAISHDDYIYKIGIIEFFQDRDNSGEHVEGRERRSDSHSRFRPKKDIKSDQIYIVSFGKDRLIKVWNLRTERCLYEIRDNLTDLSPIDPRGSVLFLKSQNDSNIYALSTGDHDIIINIWKLT